MADRHRGPNRRSGTAELRCPLRHVDAAWRDRAASEDPERTEMVVKVELLESRSVDEALPASADSGLFSSPTVVCELGDKPKHRFTVSAVEAAFGLSICDRRAQRP